MTVSWKIGDVGESLWWKIYLTVKVNRNVLFIFLYGRNTADNIKKTA